MPGELHMSDCIDKRTREGLTSIEMYNLPSLGHGKVRLVQFCSYSGEYAAWTESEAFGGSHTATTVGFQLCALRSCIISYIVLMKGLYLLCG